MKQQIVKIGDSYAARYKKWWHIQWRYVGELYSWTTLQIYSDMRLWDVIECCTSDEAENRLKAIDKKIVVIKKH